MTQTLERRHHAFEIRAKGRRLEGYAAVFGPKADIGPFTETIRPGAFARSLTTNRDILALADHDPTRVLARTKSGTLRLAEDSHGLSFSFDVPDTQAGRDVLALAERGDIGGMSFGFYVPKGGDQWAKEQRTLIDIDLLEISVVSAWPAYPATTVDARSLAFRHGIISPAEARFRLACLGGQS